MTERLAVMLQLYDRSLATKCGGGPLWFHRFCAEHCEQSLLNELMWAQSSDKNKGENPSQCRKEQNSLSPNEYEHHITMKLVEIKVRVA